MWKRLNIFFEKITKNPQEHIKIFLKRIKITYKIILILNTKIKIILILKYKDLHIYCIHLKNTKKKQLLTIVISW